MTDVPEEVTEVTTQLLSSTFTLRFVLAGDAPDRRKWTTVSSSDESHASPGGEEVDLQIGTGVVRAKHAVDVQRDGTLRRWDIVLDQVHVSVLSWNVPPDLTESTLASLHLDSPSELRDRIAGQVDGDIACGD